MIRVGIAELKARLSEHLRTVRSGRILTVVDRNTPVAQIVPYDQGSNLQVRAATRKPGSLRLPKATARPTNSVAVLLQDRASR
jgi:prevent-host-death family protein